MGVRTPKAAAVAAATIGFAMLVHTPNGVILRNGLLSIILAAGILTNTLLIGNTFNGVGAAPKEQLRIAVPVTNCPIIAS
jgi:hypothetical protein